MFVKIIQGKNIKLFLVTIKTFHLIIIFYRSYLHTLAAVKEGPGSLLLTYHNIAFQMRLMSEIRRTIRNQTFPDFVKEFMLKQFPKKNYPTWVIESLESVGIKLT